MANAIFGKFKQFVFDRSHVNGGGVDMDTDDVWAMLITTAGVTTAHNNRNTWEDKADVDGAAIEIAGTEYVAGGKDAGVVTVNYNAGTVTFDITDPVWGSVGSPATFTAGGMILYRKSAAAGDSLLIALYDFGGDQVVANGIFTVQVHANGLFQVV